LSAAGSKRGIANGKREWVGASYVRRCAAVATVRILPRMANKELDRIDCRILEILQIDGRVTN
jgi:hypothetical protein